RRISSPPSWPASALAPPFASFAIPATWGCWARARPASTRRAATSSSTPAATTGWWPTWGPRWWKRGGRGEWRPVPRTATAIAPNSQPLGRTARDPDTPDYSFETLARDGANACCFGAGIGFERAVYATFGMPPRHLNNLDIMLPFFAHLLKGVHFIRKPLLRYRVHGKNNSLSLIAARSDELGRLRTHERIFFGHLAHSLVMRDVLDRLRETMPARYAELAPRIAPLLDIQTTEMAKKLVRARVALEERQSAAAPSGG